MRQDLTKLAFDGHSSRSFKRSKSGEHHVVRKAKKFKLSEDLEVADDFSRSCLGFRCTKVSGDWDSGDWNFSWRTLRRVLSAQAGRPWVEVYGEIQKVSHWYVRDELNLLVTKATYYDQGRVKGYSRYGFEGQVSGLHVNPLDGILDNSPQGSRRSSRREREALLAKQRSDVCRRTTKKDEYHVKHEGQWYVYRVVKADHPEAYRSGYPTYLVPSLYKEGLVGVERRQLSRAEKRKYQLT